MNDSYDSVEWAAALPDSNGNVGMSPHLAAIAPAMTSSDYYDGWSYEGVVARIRGVLAIQTIALVSARRTGDQPMVAKILDATGKIAQTYSYLPQEQSHDECRQRNMPPGPQRRDATMRS